MRIKTSNFGGTLPLSLSLNMNNPFGGSGGGGAGGVVFGGAPQLSAPATQAASAPATPHQPAPSGIVPNTTVEGMAPNPADKGNGLGNTAEATGGQTPLDEYSKLYDTKPNGGKPEDQKPDVLSASINDYQTAAGKLDFTRGLDAELASKALGGDPSALMELINGAARNAFAQSSYSASQVTKSALDSSISGVRDSIPEILRKQQARAGVLDSNAALSHPAAKPLVAAVQAQIAQTYPEATPRELEAHTLKYLQNFSGLFNTQDPSEAPQGLESGESDSWDNYFS